MRGAASLLLLVGCLPEGRAELEVPTTLVPVSPASYTDADGHAIVLEEASLELAWLRLVQPSEAEGLARIPWPGLAYAHPGHDDAGDVGGELTGRWVVDLLAGPTELGTARVFEGDYPTAELDHDGPARLAGTVDGRPFAFDLTPDQTLTAIDFGATISADAPPSGIEVRVDIAWALSYVPWSEATDTDGDGVLTERDAELGELLLFGLHSNAGYEVRIP